MQTDDQLLIDRIVDHEGLKQSAYTDSLGYLTIGIGTLIDGKKGGKLTVDECYYLCRNRLALRRKELSTYDWFNSQNIVRQNALVEMAFNLGTNGLLGFKKMISAMSVNNYRLACIEMKDSLWSKQVGENRTNDLCYRILHGEYQ